MVLHFRNRGRYSWQATHLRDCATINPRGCSHCRGRSSQMRPKLQHTEEGLPRWWESCCSRNSVECCLSRSYQSQLKFSMKFSGQLMRFGLGKNWNGWEVKEIALYGLKPSGKDCRIRRLGMVHLTPILLLAKPGWKSQICYIGPFLWIDALFSFLSHGKPSKGSKIWYSGRC
jgi:hypothetical protein